jgi:hypothetical protein
MKNKGTKQMSVMEEFFYGSLKCAHDDEVMKKEYH